jgi:hypothetical protein
MQPRRKKIAKKRRYAFGRVSSRFDLFRPKKEIPKNYSMTQMNSDKIKWRSGCRQTASDLAGLARLSAVCRQPLRCSLPVRHTQSRLVKPSSLNGPHHHGLGCVKPVKTVKSIFGHFSTGNGCDPICSNYDRRQAFYGFYVKFTGECMGEKAEG